MHWNWLDILVIVVAVVPIILTVIIAGIVLKIKNGPVARIIGAVSRNVNTGKKLVETGKSAGLASLPHLITIRARVMLLPRSFHPIELTDAPITYGSAQKPLALLGTFRALRGGQRTRRRREQISVLDRVGLVPPVWNKVKPYLGYAGTVMAVWKEVQNQLPAIRKALSERGSA